MTPQGTPQSPALVDYVRVGRESHELQLRHGRNAHTYALRLSEHAVGVGDAESAALWYAVYQNLVPRA